MRTIFRMLAAAFLALAVVLLVADGTAMLAASTFVATPLAATIKSFFPGVLEGWQASLGQAINPAVWEPTLTTVLSLPGWAVFGAVGLAFAYLGRARNPRALVAIDQF